MTTEEINGYYLQSNLCMECLYEKHAKRSAAQFFDDGNTCNCQ